MPTVACAVCGEVKTLTKQDYGYQDKDGDFVCSVVCVINWMKQVDVVHPLKILAEWDQRSIEQVSYDRGTDHLIQSPRTRQWFMSHFEMHVMEVLERMGYSMLYEYYGFRWGSKSYLPDFFSVYSNAFLEVKGLWRSSSRSKYKSFRKAFPEVRMLVVPWTLAADFHSLHKEIT